MKKNKIEKVTETIKDLEYRKNRLFTDNLKSQAIKWIKKDYEDLVEIQEVVNETGDKELWRGLVLELISRNQKRFNIEKEDLKKDIREEIREEITKIHKKNFDKIKKNNLNQGDYLIHKKKKFIEKITNINSFYGWVISKRIDERGIPELKQDLSNLDEYEKIKFKKLK